MSETGGAALPPVFDGHNDTLLSLAGTGRDFFTRSDTGHIDLPRAREGGLGGGFYACFARSPQGTPDAEGLPPAPDEASARAEAFALGARLFRLERESGGALRVVRTVDELRACMADGTHAAIFHIEGAESIDPEFNTLEVGYQAGLRSLGLVWSRANRYGWGVPFRAGASPDIGPRLTDDGRALVRACNSLGILIDLSHLNEKGFWDVAALSQAPLVATHSNAWTLAPFSRNLTDQQLDAIRDSDGMVGVNFGVSFLNGQRPAGGVDANVPLSLIADHVDYLVQRIGVQRVGLGSDFDGTTIPAELRDVTGLRALLAELQRRGYGDADLRRLAWENWARVLALTWR